MLTHKSPFVNVNLGLFALIIYILSSSRHISGILQVVRQTRIAHVNTYNTYHTQHPTHAFASLAFPLNWENLEEMSQFLHVNLYNDFLM